MVERISADLDLERTKPLRNGLLGRPTGTQRRARHDREIGFEGRVRASEKSPERDARAPEPSIEKRHLESRERARRSFRRLFELRREAPPTARVPADERCPGSIDCRERPRLGLPVDGREWRCFANSARAVR